MVPIKTAPALQQAIASTYIYDAIIAVVFVLVLVIVANLIKCQPGKVDRSGMTRRVWFFILGALALVTSLVFDYFVFASSIQVPAFLGKYFTHMALASVVSAVVYYLISFVIVYASRIGTKMQSIFPKKDK